MPDKAPNASNRGRWPTRVLWVAASGGFLVVYLLLVGYELEHPFHWNYLGAGVVIALIVLRLWFGTRVDSTDGNLIEVSSRLMREDWDERARDDPLYYVCVMHGRQFQDIETYFEAGKEQAIALMNPALEVLRISPSGKRILEVGCGIGRLFPGFAELGFDEIRGVDISPGMIKLGEQWCPVRNAQFDCVDGQGLTGIASNYFDFCLSYSVFQHLPDERVLWQYLSEIHRTLVPGAAFQLHFQGRRTIKRRALLLIPGRARSTAQILYRLANLCWVRGRPVRSPKRAGRAKTWELGIAVSPQRVVDRLRHVGFRDIQILPDPTYKDGTKFWAIGHKV